MPNEVPKGAIKESRPGVDVCSGTAPDAGISEPAIIASRTCGGFGPAQEHRTERSQGCPVTDRTFPDRRTDVPSGRGFIALLEAFRATGGTAPGEFVGRLLEEHQVGNAVSLTKLISTGQAFGFKWRDSLWMPMFQFDANDLVLKVSAQRVRAGLPSLWSGWNVATWFATPNVRLGGHTPANALDSDVEAVIRSAGSLKAVDQFSVPLVRRAREVATHV